MTNTRKQQSSAAALSLGPRTLGTSSSSSARDHPPGQNNLQCWSQEFFMDQPFVRNFVVASSEIFSGVQREVRAYYPDPVPPKVVTSLSRMYRSLLLELCTNLKTSGDLTSAELYSNLDFVWNFCEILFLSSHPDFPILPFLSDWIRVNFDLTPDILPKVIEQGSELDGETSEQLWTLIFSHTFHGATQEAARLLQYVRYTATSTNNEDKKGGGNSSSVQDRQISLMSELLIKKPEYVPEVGSISEFEHLFQAWQDECLNRLENGAFVGDDNFIFLAKILCGDDAAYETAVTKLNWYEFMVLLLNYKYPTIRPSQLKAYAAKTLDILGLKNKLESRDMILLHAMDFNILNVLKEVQGVWDNPWFALHFSDLVFACGRNISEEEVVDYSLVAPLRNHFILEYGATVMEHPTLWQMGIHYLEALPESTGRFVIRECLQRRNPDSEMEAQKLIQIAERFGFGDEIKGICRQVCLSKLRQGGPDQAQNALLWAIKSGDESLTTRIVDSILFEGDCEIDSSLLDSLKNILCSVGSLQFLSDFCTFRKLMSEGEGGEGGKKASRRAAVNILCNLIKKDLIPKRLAHKILLKNIEIFDDGQNFQGGGQDHVTTLMEYTHTTLARPPNNLKEGEEGGMSPSEKQLLNQKLIRIRTFQILSQFRAARNEDEEDNYCEEEEDYRMEH